MLSAKILAGRPDFVPRPSRPCSGTGRDARATSLVAALPRWGLGKVADLHDRSAPHLAASSPGFRQSPRRDEKDPSPTALRSPLSPTERDRNQNHTPLPGGEGGPQGGG